MAEIDRTVPKRRVRLRLEALPDGERFSITAKEVAMQLGLTGTLSLLPAGSVEVVAEGNADAVDRLIKWAGHEGGEQSGLTVEDEAVRGEYDEFRVYS